MGKYQQECDYQLVIANQAKEIERLNAHIIVLSDALNFECGDRCNAEYNPCNAREALNISGIDVGNWLTTHDQKVRDDALELRKGIILGYEAQIRNQAITECMEELYLVEGGGHYAEVLRIWKGETK